MGSSATQAQLCQFCRVEPRYHDKRTGEFHSFCSETCASKSAHWVAALCEYCRKRPKSGSNPFCGRECLDWHIRSITGQNVAESVRPTCSLTGCTQPAVMYPVGTYWNYCSPNHQELAVNGCINCRALPYTINYPLCLNCNAHLADGCPYILPVPQDHIAYLQVHNLFLNSWATGGKRPEVRMIYRIISAWGFWDNFWAYRDFLEAGGTFSAHGLYPGNERLMWHGTPRACRLGEQGQTTLCESSDCSLCSIVRTSFDLTYAMTNRYRRFGPGIYTSSKSSKANNYSKNTRFTSPCKAVLLNSVLAGFPWESVDSVPYLMGPPPGFDSVYGTPDKDLNDVLVVYTDHAIRPMHIVVYELV